MIRIILATVIIAELIFGCGAFVNAKSAIHEIEGLLALGFAFLTLAAYEIVVQLMMLNGKHIEPALKR